MTHEVFYDLLQALSLATSAYLFGKQAGWRQGIKDGASAGAKQVLEVLEDRGLLLDPEEEALPPVTSAQLREATKQAIEITVREPRGST